MQKVITVVGSIFLDKDQEPVVREQKYDELQKLLDEGYKIANTIPLHNEKYYAITFILQKEAD